MLRISRQGGIDAGNQLAPKCIEFFLLPRLARPSVTSEKKIILKNT
jgi:hypothetical protein